MKLTSARAHLRGNPSNRPQAKPSLIGNARGPQSETTRTSFPHSLRHAEQNEMTVHTLARAPPRQPPTADVISTPCVGGPGDRRARRDQAGREQTDGHPLNGERHGSVGKGQMGSALMGSLQITCFWTEGLFGYSS